MGRHQEAIANHGEKLYQHEEKLIRLEKQLNNIETHIALAHLIGAKTGEALNDLEISLHKISSAFLNTTDSHAARKWVDLAFGQLKYVTDNIREAQDIARKEIGKKEEGR